MRLRWLDLVLVTALLWGTTAHAERIIVAVAANFLTTAQGLADGFSAGTGHEVALVSGSTGALYAQILAGAPFDLFLAADAARPERLEAEGRVRAGDRQAYALGRLVLAGRDLPEAGDWRVILSDTGSRLAMANPRTAPYGAAARQLLIGVRGKDDWDRGAIFGDSVGQAFAFLATGNAKIGLVALAQTRQPGHELAILPIPDTAYAPIRQEAVLLARAGNKPAARSFLAYLSGDPARSLIARAGYGLPGQ